MEQATTQQGPQQRVDDMYALMSTNPARMGGIPCFAGTRVSVHTLFDYLAGGQSLAEFADDFPTVPIEQAAALVRLASDHLEALALATIQHQDTSLSPEHAASSR